MLSMTVRSRCLRICLLWVNDWIELNESCAIRLAGVDLLLTNVGRARIAEQQKAVARSY
jgi:hypothetical protein